VDHFFELVAHESIALFHVFRRTNTAPFGIPLRRESVQFSGKVRQQHVGKIRGVR
jgi:hypothetical protein